MQNSSFQATLVASALVREMEERFMTQNADWDSDVLHQSFEQEKIAAVAAFTGLSLMAAVTFVAGYESFSSDAPVTWSHGLIALSVGQLAILAGISFKIYRLLERNRSLASRAANRVTRPIRPAIDRPVVTIPTPVAAFEMPSDLPKAFIGNREYVTYPDGSVELDTLLGRRRFVSLDAAEEFVGR